MCAPPDTTTLAVLGDSLANDERCVYDDKYPKGSLPLTIIPITGENVDAPTVEKCIAEAEGLIVAFDSERVLPETSMNVFIPPEGNSGKLSHVSVMSRSLNGEGMGFTASAAKAAANPDIWAGGRMVDEYKAMETRLCARAALVNADCTIIRAGTLKGGGSGDVTTETAGGGEPNFLNPFFYTLGQQDIVVCAHRPQRLDR